MKLVLIAIFSVILLVVCEPQQEALADGDTSGLYYNFDKSYGWNFDSRLDESRYDEVDHSQRSYRSRDNKSGEEVDPDIKKKDQNYNDRNREKQNDHPQNNNHVGDRNRYRENDKDNNGKHERYNERDKNWEEGNDNVDSNRDDKGRSDKNKDFNKEDKNKDRSQDKYRKKGNESENRNGEKQYSKNIDSTQESDKDKNYDRQNQYNKSSPDDQNNQRGFDKQDKDRGYKSNNEKDDSNYKNDKNRKQEKERENDKNDKGIKKYDSDSKNKNDANTNYKKETTNEDKDDRRRYQEVVNRDDKKDKENNYDSKYNVQSNKNRNNGNDDYSREPENKGSSRLDEKDMNSNNNYQYKGEKQSYSRSKSESYKEKSYTNHSPGYGYTYLESLITAPKSNSDNSKDIAMEGPKYKDSRSKEQGKKKEVIEIHGYISKGKEQSDKQVEVDVIVKKADTTLGTGLDTNGGIHIHKVLNNEENEKGYQIEEPQSKLTYEYIKPDKKSENKEKDYRQLFNNHIQDKKDLLGGIELLGLISNIGQEIKEQVIEKIPGYHIIQNLDPRRQKNKSKQEYIYDQNQKNPKIDLEVYYPPKKQDEDKGKKVESKSFSQFDKQDKDTEIFAKEKNKKERVNSKYLHQDRKLINEKEDTYKSMEKNEILGKYIYTANKDNINKEKDIDIHTKPYGERNKEVKGYQQEGQKEIYDYKISHKQIDRGEKNSQKYVTSNNYDSEKNNEGYQYDVKYNSGSSYKKSEKNDITEQPYNNRKNGGYQDPNYFYEPVKIKQDLVNYNHNDDYPSRKYLLQDRGSHGPYYRGPEYSNQPDKINPLQDFIKSKQKEDKYIYDYTIGNLEKQGPVFNYNTPHSTLPYSDNKSLGQYDKQRDYSYYNEYRPANEYEYNSKHNYDPKPNEGWSYQGFSINDQGKEKLEEKNNFPKYEEDKEDQGYIRNGNPYYGSKNYDDFHYREPYYVNKGYPNYIFPNYNQGLIESGFGLPHPYPLPSLINHLSQQILGSAGRVQKYNQNYTNMPQQRDYNLHFGESKSIVSHPNNDDANNYYKYRKPVYDTAYQSSNKEYTYQYQLPYATVFARMGIS